MLQKGHSPQGECGLKFSNRILEFAAVMSLPARGVWIEIAASHASRYALAVTPRKGSVD